MPILEAEPELFPSWLFGRLNTRFESSQESSSQSWNACEDFGVSGSVDDGRRWWVSHTKPRQEKSLARDLLDSRIHYYLPCHRRRIKVRSKVVTSRIPLFCGYVFVRFSEGERSRVLNTNRVAALIPVVEQHRLHLELQRVHRVLDLGEPVTPETDITTGMTVTVRSGPLSGMTGRVQKVLGGFKFIVSVDFIRRGLSVVMDGASLGVCD